MTQSVKLRHNAEMAHRLTKTPGKCERLHGHSWWIELEIYGPVTENGMILDFGHVKKWMREFIDSTWDHRTLLNSSDPLYPILTKELPERAVSYLWDGEDPTVENVAKFFGHLAQQEFGPDYEYRVEVSETHVNKATWEG